MGSDVYPTSINAEQDEKAYYKKDAVEGKDDIELEEKGKSTH